MDNDQLWNLIPKAPVGPGAAFWECILVVRLRLMRVGFPSKRDKRKNCGSVLAIQRRNRASAFFLSVRSSFSMGFQTYTVAPMNYGFLAHGLWVWPVLTTWPGKFFWNTRVHHIASISEFLNLCGISIHCIAQFWSPLNLFLKPFLHLYVLPPNPCFWPIFWSRSIWLFNV